MEIERMVYFNFGVVLALMSAILAIYYSSWGFIIPLIIGIMIMFIPSSRSSDKSVGGRK